MSEVIFSRSLVKGCQWAGEKLRGNTQRQPQILGVKGGRKTMREFKSVLASWDKYSFT